MSNTRKAIIGVALIGGAVIAGGLYYQQNAETGEPVTTEPTQELSEVLGDAPKKVVPATVVPKGDTDSDTDTVGGDTDS